jgi:hypothetical protein
VNPPASRYQSGWVKRRPLPKHGRPCTIFLVGATPKTVFLGLLSNSFDFSFYLTCLFPSQGLDPDVTVGDIMEDLRRRRLIPDLTRVEHYLLFPPCRSSPLLSHERLVDLGVKDLSTLYLRCRCLHGGSPASKQASEFSFNFFFMSAAMD